METLGRVLKALSDETRLAIMGLIFRHGHLCVCEVQEVLGITQSKASRHLRYLRDAGVLEDERLGPIVNYRLPAAPAGELAAVLDLMAELLPDRPLPDAEALLARMRQSRQDPLRAAGEAGQLPSAPITNEETTR